MVERRKSSNRLQASGNERLVSLESNGEEVKGEVGGTIGQPKMARAIDNSDSSLSPANQNAPARPAPINYFQRMCQESAQNIEQRMQDNPPAASGPSGEQKSNEAAAKAARDNANREDADIAANNAAAANQNQVEMLSAGSGEPKAKRESNA